MPRQPLKNHEQASQIASIENQISFEKTKFMIFKWLMWAGFFIGCGIIIIVFITAYDYYIYLLSDKEKLFIPFIENVATHLLAAASGAIPTFLIVRRK